MDNEHLNKMEDISSKLEKETFSAQNGENVSVSENASSDKKPGALLAKKRIEAGLTEEKMAARLKLTVRQIHYIESDDYEALHGITMARGFVRAYARALQIDPDPLVAQFASKKTVDKQISLKSQQSPELFVQNNLSFRNKRSLSSKVLIFLIIVVIAVIVAWNMKLFSLDNRFFKKESSDSTTITKPVTPEVVAPVAEKKEVNSLPNNDANKVPEVVINSENLPQTVKTSVGNAPIVTSPAVKNEAINAEGKSALLVMKFKEKSWVKIQRKDGSVLTEYIGKPGEQRRLEVNGPVMLTIGYAPGVNVEFRGAPVELARGTNNTVAKITLK